jgi:cell division protein FtsX
VLILPKCCISEDIERQGLWDGGRRVKIYQRGAASQGSLRQGLKLHRPCCVVTVSLVLPCSFCPGLQSARSTEASSIFPQMRYAILNNDTHVTERRLKCKVDLSKLEDRG